MSVRITRMQNTAHGFTLLAEQHVPVGPEHVRCALSRPADMGRWFDIDYEWPTSVDEPMEVGAALEFRVSVGPLSYEFIMIVADRVPDESIMLRTTKGVVDATIEYTWEPAEDGTVVRFDGDFRLRGSLWWKSRWARVLTRRAVTRGLERMREDMLACASRREPALAGAGSASSAGSPASGTRAATAGLGATRGPVRGHAARGHGAHRRVSGRRRAENV